MILPVTLSAKVKQLFAPGQVWPATAALAVEGVGTLSVLSGADEEICGWKWDAILKARRTHKIRDLADLRKLGIRAPEQASPYILFQGRRPPQQLSLFDEAF